MVEIGGAGVKFAAEQTGAVVAAGRHGLGTGSYCICISFSDKTPSDVTAGAGCETVVTSNVRNPCHQRDVTSWMSG